VVWASSANAAELGLVGSAIPTSGGTATSIPLDIGSRSQAPQIQYPTVPAFRLAALWFGVP